MVFSMFVYLFLHSVWQAWVCKYHHLGNRVMFTTFWLKVEPNWLKHSVLGAGYN